MGCKRILVFFGLVVLCNGISAQKAGLHHTEGFGSNPGNLDMYSYSPANLEEGDYPLVVVFHGCTQSAKEVAHQTGWNKLADSLQFFVLYPQTKVGNSVAKCFRWYSEKHISGNAGESASVHQMISHFTQNHPVDSSRIFITGLSAGGAMAVVMLARYPELFSSGAIIAGGPYGAAWNIGSARKAVRGRVKHKPEEWAALVQAQNPGFNGTYPTLSIYHGTKDKTVHPRNAKHLVAQWTSLHGAAISPAMIRENFNGLPHVELRLYNNPEGNTAVRYYVLRDVKHALSIAAGSRLHHGGKAGRYTEDTGFHVTWQCAVDFGLTE